MFIKHNSQYNAIENYVDELEIAFQCMGYSVYVIDPMEAETITNILTVAIAGKVDILFTFNATFVEMQQIKKYFLKQSLQLIFVITLCITKTE